MNIVGKRNCLHIILDRNISKSILEQVPNSVGFAIEIHRIRGKNTAHARRYLLMRIVDHKMKVIRHETPRRNTDAIADKLILEQREHPIAIFIVFEDADAAITTRDNVVIAR